MSDVGLPYTYIKIDETKCQRCYDCIKYCPQSCLYIDKGIIEQVSRACMKCEYCMDVCPNGALTVII